MSSSVVLVHGAWHGAWCWERVVQELSDRGVTTVAVDLPGHGDDGGPPGDLHADAARVREVLDRVPAPVVLVGHSYGGAVITEAGDHPSVGRLVYLCAMVLDGDETCMTAAADEVRAARISHQGRPDPSVGMIPGEDGTTRLDAATAAACLYNDCDPDTVAWAVARLGPQPMGNLGQVPGAVAWRSKLSTYVVCTDDQIIHPAIQEILAGRCSDRVAWDCSHSPFLSRPSDVADLFATLADG